MITEKSLEKLRKCAEKYEIKMKVVDTNTAGKKTISYITFAYKDFKNFRNFLNEISRDPKLSAELSQRVDPYSNESYRDSYVV